MDTATLAPRRLGSLLVDKGYLTLGDLQSALERQKQEGRKKLLGEILVEQGYCTEDQVIECLAAEYGVPYAKLDARLLDPKVVDVLPREYVEKNLVLPLFLVRGVLTIAVSEPSNLFLIDEIRGLTGAQVQIVAASPKDIRRTIATLPNSKVFVIDDIIEHSDTADATLIEQAIEQTGDVQEIAGQSPVVRLVNYIILNAVKEGASHVHVEPSERSMRVRYRIDGRLHKALEVPQHLLDAVTSRIKTMGAMDVDQRHMPQDGEVHVMLEGRKIDLRVSTFPAARGERTVIHVLGARAVSLKLEDLGFAEDVLTAFQASIRAPNGVDPGDGADGKRKIDHALRRPRRAGDDGKQRLHRRRPDRMPPAVGEPIPGADEDRHDLPHGVADPPASGPGRDHGGRDPRRGDRAGDDPGGLERAARLQHLAHPRRLLGHHPADQHGRRAVLDRRGAATWCWRSGWCGASARSAAPPTSLRGRSARPSNAWASKSPSIPRGWAAAPAATRVSADASASTSC